MFKKRAYITYVAEDGCMVVAGFTCCFIQQRAAKLPDLFLPHPYTEIDLTTSWLDINGLPAPQIQYVCWHCARYTNVRIIIIIAAKLMSAFVYVLSRLDYCNAVHVSQPSKVNYCSSLHSNSYRMRQQDLLHVRGHEITWRLLYNIYVGSLFNSESSTSSVFWYILSASDVLRHTWWSMSQSNNSCTQFQVTPPLCK